MKALGMIETLSIPRGIEAADTMLKTANVDLVMAQAVCAGKYIVLVSGEVAAVKSAVEAALTASRESLVDSLVIPNIHDDVFRAIAASSEVSGPNALGIMETFSLCAAIYAADAAIKAAQVELIEVRLGRGLGGKSFVTLNGEVAAVRAAVKAAENIEETAGMMAASVVIPSPHVDVLNALY